jgi:hypothetical protein
MLPTKRDHTSVLVLCQLFGEKWAHSRIAYIFGDKKKRGKGRRPWAILREGGVLPVLLVDKVSGCCVGSLRSTAAE